MIGFAKVNQVLLGFTGLHLILLHLGFTGFLTKFYGVLLGFTGFQLIILNLTWFYWVFHQVLWEFTGL